MKSLFHAYEVACTVAALDSWTEKPRIWMAGGIEGSHDKLSVWEEGEGGFEKIMEFDEEAKKEAGSNYMGGWPGGVGGKLVCDPLRGHAYVRDTFCFHLRSGRLMKCVRHSFQADDFAFDKYGYMHGHFSPIYQRGVGRYDPDQGVPTASPDFEHLKNLRCMKYTEVPYDYGDQPAKKDHIGVLPVKDQGGVSGTESGLGVNMLGDIAEECSIYYAPLMDDAAREAMDGSASAAVSTYSKLMQQIVESEKQGDHAYYIKREAGVPLVGSTIWTFKRTGEPRQECAVIAGRLIDGVQMDEDWMLYFAMNRQRLRDRKVFLSGRLGVFGDVSGKHPFTGTFAKTAGKKVRVLLENSPVAPVPLDPKPGRPPEVGGGPADDSGTPQDICWVEGAKWLYAGASPVSGGGDSRSAMRACTDWFKRSFVPEAYRHSIGVLDANGNLVLHMGQYGNFDSADGPKSRIPVSGDGIAISFCENVSATDDYLCFEDNGERIAVIKLDYYAEETTPIGAGKKERER
jgi:hypothetical protein